MSVRRCLLVPLFVLAALLPFAGASAAQDGEPEVVASGLDNPRGLDFGPWGGLYVAEAGRGGEGPCIESPESGVQCVGASGAITKIWHGKQRSVLEGLPSIAAQGSPATPESPEVLPGSEALGPNDISFSGFRAYFPVGLGGEPALRDDQLGELGPEFGQLYKASPYRGVRAVADLAAFEAEKNPDGDLLNSNPTSVLARHGRQYVVDAGANDLLKVGPTGRIRTLAVFPKRLIDPAPIPDLPNPFPMDAVPTAVVQGPDHDLYVSQLTGFPFPVGGANIYRVDKRGGVPEVYASGFTNVTDLAFDRDGNLYVVEIATNGLLSGDPTGALKRIAPDRSVSEDLANGGLVAPYGVAISRKGHIYVSTHSTEPDEGEVVRIDGGGWK